MHHLITQIQKNGWERESGGWKEGERVCAQIVLLESRVVSKQQRIASVIAYEFRITKLCTNLACWFFPKQERERAVEEKTRQKQKETQMLIAFMYATI